MMKRVIDVSILPFIVFVIGLVLIIKGGDWFIDSASWVARTTGMPEVLIGATIVSLGTTLPELVVSSAASLQGHSEMAIGNAIGSTICNTGLILGVCNLISPSKINSRVYNVKAVILIFYISIFFIMALDGKIGRMDSSILILCLLIYILVNYLEVNVKTTSSSRQKRSRFYVVTQKEIGMNLIKFVTGSICIVLGANLLVDNGIIIAGIFKVPHIVISLTAIALGTSLPELVTSVTALIKGHKNLSIGNILGANILNISMVLGISSAFRPLNITAPAIQLHIPFSFLMMLTLTAPTIFTWKISRIHASVLVGLYVIYLVILGYMYV